jgi:predicted porin
MIGLGYYHTLTKQTQAYVMGTWIDNKDLGLYGAAGGTNAGNLTNVGATIWAATVGLKHTF